MGVAELIIFGWIAWQTYGAFEDVRGLHQAAAIYQKGQSDAKDESDRHKAAALLIGDLYRKEVEKTNDYIQNSPDPCRDLPPAIGNRMVDGWWSIIAEPVGVLPGRAGKTR